MAEPSELSQPGALVLFFDHGRAIEAGELGKLLSVLARDYRRYSSGRSLSVARIETGSLLVVLKDAATYLSDAAEILKGIKAAGSFARRIVDLIRQQKEALQPVPLFGKGRKRTGVASVEALYEIAAASGCEVTIRHSMPDGETVDAHFLPVEAIAARENAKVRNQPPLSLINGDTESFLKSLPYSANAASIAPIVQSLTTLYGLEGDKLNSSELSPLMQAIASTLRSNGLGAFVEIVASDLERRGLHEAASALRAAASRG